MKILLTIHHYLDPNAGAPGATLKLGREYQKLGHEVHYYGFNRLPDKMPKKAKSIIFPEFLAFYMSKLSNRQSFDVVDASTGDAWIWAKMSWSGRASRPLLVTRSHGLEHTSHCHRIEEAKTSNQQLSWKYPLYHGGFRLWEVATSMRYADLSFLLNQDDLEYAVNKLGVERKRTHIVSNGICEEFLNLPFEPTPKTQDSIIGIAQIGNYIPRKGINYSVPALNNILNRYPQVRVSFLGTGCSEAKVYQDFDPGVRARIQVIPRYTHEILPRLLKGHQIKILSSLFEGLPLVLIEAMACGLTPITTSLPGPMEIIKDKQNGISIPLRNSQAIERSLFRLIEDRSYTEFLRQNAYVTAQKYSWQRVARHNLSLYEEALSKRKYSSASLHCS